MKNRLLIYLLAIGITALCGCASVSPTRPPFGSYTTLQVRTLDDHTPAVDIQRLMRNGTGTAYSPAGTFWIKTGHYMALLRCNRPYKTADGTEMRILGTADGPDFNFEFDITDDSYYELNCTTSDHGQQFEISAMLVSAIAQ